MKTRLYTKIASLLDAIENCKKSNNTEWQIRHEDYLNDLLHKHLPHGSGFDSGCTLSEHSTSEKLIFTADFHHMDSNGYYCGWTHHKVVVTPSLCWDINIKVTGRDRNDIKNYIHEVFYTMLMTCAERW